ncbi:hypothetical protein LTR10_015270 [Elasticomyces elasticus]|uniref:Transcription factor domain-containing protein n=1 Tax=Exophiala sideris TaxID=1016849 RepID=A0ABR0JGE1_9EURO|nr:hypothetical protein LTR10_015270 [Elasticomyces elasticus]KAK5032745.1 hypothetical protein LTS07_004155 [Exophiala sideris]KAK5037075.1 hypothetical protein LTR13_004880 [Exophiala sideris]KAK5062269.1 hypothetical protein LTR69_004627 [Exophiala sideris]KAK5182233.1 hypothetical protein LTR44_005244 [Eurotiomycetes sp. CCFEE 6388]
MEKLTEGAAAFLNHAKIYFTACDSNPDQGLQSQTDPYRSHLPAPACEVHAIPAINECETAKQTENSIPRLAPGRPIEQSETVPSRLIDSALLVHATAVSEARQMELSWARFFIDQLSSSCKQYLMNCFSTRYNSIFHVVNMDVFLESMTNYSKPHYSLFLHSTILAIGLMYAEPHNPEVQALQSNEHGAQMSALHHQCRLLLESELGDEPTVALAQGLLLLAEIELRQSTGYLGCLLIGCDKGVLEACLVYDTYRSQILRRPTVLRGRNAETLRDKRNNPQLFTASARMEQLIYNSLLDLMELVHAFLDKYSARSTCETDAGAFFEMTSVHQNLAQCYSSWPQALKLDLKNPMEGEQSLLFLHLYYHNAILCLHQSWGFPSDMIIGDGEDGSDAYEEARKSCQAVCLDHAKMISRVLGKWPGRSYGTQIPTQALGYASNAMTHVLTALEQSEIMDSRAEALECLRSLESVLPATLTERPGQSFTTRSSDEATAGWRSTNAAQQQARMLTSPRRQKSTCDRAALSEFTPGTIITANRRGISLPGNNNSELLASYSSDRISTQTDERRPGSQVHVAQDGSNASDGASLFDQGDPNYDPIFLPKERQLLGLSSSGQ